MCKNRLHSRPWFRLGLFARINLVSTVMIFVVLMLVCVLLTTSLIHPGLEKDRLLNEEASNQLATLITQKYSAAFNQSKLLHTPEHVSERIHNQSVSNDPFFSYEDIRFISNYLTAMRFGDDDLLDVMIIPLNHSNVFFTSAHPTRRADVRYDYSTLDIVADLLASNYNISATFTSQQPYLVPSETEIVTFAVKIFDSVSVNYEVPIGVMLINYPLSVFSDAYQKLGDLSGGSVYVINRENEIFFSTEPEYLGSVYDESLQEDAEVTVRSIGISGLKLINIMPIDALNSATAQMIRSLLYIMCPTLFILLLTVFLSNRRYRVRLDTLAQAMQNYSTGGEQIPVTVHNNDELDILASQFNEMCQRLDLQIKMHYQAEVARKSAELNALQAQINPHFLYNTIECIRMQAVEDGNLDVSDMLMQLGQMFHWMIQLDKQIVYLEDEIDYNEAYLNLQKIRYQDSFESEINISDEALYLGVPKFTIQPIVENALLHGLKENGLSGLISVDAHVQSDTLIIEIKDDGKGMDPQTLQKLQHHISKEDPCEFFGIGMQNVHSRIQMLFGENYGVHVQSEPGMGTVVTITLPAQAKKEMEKQVEQATRGE